MDGEPFSKSDARHLREEARLRKDAMKYLDGNWCESARQNKTYNQWTYEEQMEHERLQEAYEEYLKVNPY